MCYGVHFAAKKLKPYFQEGDLVLHDYDYADHPVGAGDVEKHGLLSSRSR